MVRALDKTYLAGSRGCTTFLADPLSHMGFQTHEERLVLKGVAVALRSSRCRSYYASSSSLTYRPGSATILVRHPATSGCSIA